jgi:hypothetical protein
MSFSASASLTASNCSSLPATGVVSCRIEIQPVPVYS